MKKAKPESLLKLSAKPYRLSESPESYEFHSCEPLCEEEQALRRELKQRSLLLGMLAHDVLNSLHSLAGFNRLLLERELSLLKRHQYLQIMNQEILSLYRLGQDLLTLSQLDLSRQGEIDFSLQRKPQPIVPLLRDVLKLFESSEMAGKLTLESDLSTELSWDIDAGRLQQIVRNLLHNAFKFTTEGMIALRTHSQEGREWVEIVDTGPGIASEQQEGIFAAFQQGTDGMHRLSGGVGLGLTIAQLLCQQMDLKLSLSSQLGQGSCFRIERASPESRTCP